MLKQLLFALVTVGISFTVSAQEIIFQDDATTKQEASGHVNARLGLGQSLTISPVPLPQYDAKLQVTAVGVEYYSYVVRNAFGQIVELENLSGKPDSNYIDLNGAVHQGIYFITFETNAGNVTRKFAVI